jgi:putative membrane protein
VGKVIRAARPEEIGMRLVTKLVVNGVALLAAALLLPTYIHLNYQTSAGHIETRNVIYILLVAAVFAVVNLYIKPIAKVASIPLSLVALGLVGFIVNAVMLFLTVFVVGLIQSHPYAIKLADFPPNMSVDAVIAAIIGSIVVSIVSTVLNVVIP